MKKNTFKNVLMRLFTLLLVALSFNSCIKELYCGEDSLANPDDSTAKKILVFNFSKASNPTLSNDVTATINGTDVVLSVPFGTDLSTLKPSINFFGASVSPDPNLLQDFSKPVIYTVTAKDGSTQVYTIKTVIITANTKEITSFVIKNSLNPAMDWTDVTGVITGTNIAIELPAGTDVTALKPTILQNGNTLNPANEVAKDFTSPQTYTVTAQDGSTQVYTVTATVRTPVVYVSGYEQNGVGTPGAKYWRNGVATSLTDGVRDSFGNVIYVEGTNVYVGGRMDYDFITYWKNGVANKWTDGSKVGTAYAMQVVGTDVYLAGFQIVGSKKVAVYWKNGVQTSLTDGTQNAQANSIAISGSDVYIAGFEFNGTVNVATVWKNGVATRITDGTKDSNLREIIIKNGDVYIAGTENNGTLDVAKYWKNGVATSLTNGTLDAEATGITIRGTDIYVVGSETNGTKYVAKYWKNGVATSLTDGTQDAGTQFIVLSGKDIYVSGLEFNGTNYVAKYWKNGVATSLTDGTRRASAAGLFIVR